MATFSIFPLLTCFFSLVSLIEARNTLFHQQGFTLHLIHRDSPLSPLYNSSYSRLDLITNAFHRSVNRFAPRKTSSPPNIQSEIYVIPGEYIMNISIGSPPVEFLGIADTGSDLTWTQCSPCTDCYNQTIPIFNPDKSSSYKIQSCDSNTCSILQGSDGSCMDQNRCEYRMSYGDHSTSKGDLATETFTFGSSSGQSVSIKNVAFGCGHDNSGTFNKAVSGIIGLGGGPLSIVKQLENTIQGKFSYCLVPIYKGSNVTSQINFGNRAIVSGPGVVSTPLVRKLPDTYYYLSLESIKVGEKSFSYKAYYSKDQDHGTQGVEEGNIIIDSGTTLTLLPRDLYKSLESELIERIGLKPMTDPQGIFSLCYSSFDKLDLPVITFRFTGADVELPPTSSFLVVEEGLLCLTMVPTDELPIFGNLSQENFLVGYDLVNKQVSFKPTDCTKQ